MNKKYLIYLFLTSILLLSACGMSDETGEESADENVDSASASEETEEATEDSELVLYGNDFIEVIGPKFEEESGISVEGVHFGGGEALAQIEAEQGNPNWDIIFMDGHGSIRNLADRGFLHTDFEPENISNVKDEYEELIPEDNAYFPIGMHAAGVIAYNTDILTEEEVPKTWEEFYEYDGPIGHADPAVAAPAYPLVSGIFNEWGIEEGKEIYTERFEKGINIYPKNGPLTTGLINGEIHLAALQEHNAYEAILDDEPVDLIWPEEGAPGSLRVVAINKESDNIEEAEQFVEFLMDAETQEFLTSIDSDAASFFTPMAEGVEVREGRPENPEMMLPEAEWAAEYEEEIKTWFADQNVQ